VTGASQGIGLATAIALADAGASVAFNYRQEPKEAVAAVQRLTESGRKAVLVQADVGDEQAFSERGPFHEIDMAKFRRAIDVSMWGPLYLLRATTRQMLAQGGGGSFVVISSPHAYTPVPRSMPYNIAKAAIDHMARTAAIELVDHRIRVNIITRGWIDTPGERKFADDETIRKAGEKLPWKRLGTPEEIARGVVFLCDPASDYITGSALCIDGGLTLPWWANRGSSVPE
jgi:glucose 1-dehydrogenase